MAMLRFGDWTVGDNSTFFIAGDIVVDDDMSKSTGVTWVGFDVPVICLIVMRCA